MEGNLVTGLGAIAAFYATMWFDGKGIRLATRSCARRRGPFLLIVPGRADVVPSSVLPGFQLDQSGGNVLNVARSYQTDDDEAHRVLGFCRRNAGREKVRDLADQHLILDVYLFVSIQLRVSGEPGDGLQGSVLFCAVADGKHNLVVSFHNGHH